MGRGERQVLRRRARRCRRATRSAGRTSRTSSTFASTRTRTRSRSSSRCCSTAATARIAEAFAPKYLDLLAAGGSASPAELVAPFGLDLRSTDTWREAFAELDALREEAEQAFDTSRAVASVMCSTCCCRGAASSAARRHAALRAPAARALPRADAAALRALRRADGVAGRALPRVRGRRLAFASARAAVAYEDGVRRLVAAWKEHGLRGLGRGGRGRRRRAAAAARTPRSSRSSRPTRGRRLQRGYHPAEQLARELARAWRAALPERCSAAAARRAASAASPRAERRRNVRGASLRGPCRARRPRRRRLHDRRHRRRRRGCAPAGGRAQVDVVTFARTIRGTGLGLDRG